MKRNIPLDRLNPFARRAARSVNRRRPLSPRRRLSLESLEQRTLLAVLTVTSDADGVNDGDGQLSLEEAVRIANDSTGATSYEGIKSTDVADTIAFNINGGGAQTITLDNALPAIKETVTIDGSTQPPDSSGTSLITIDASIPGSAMSLYTGAEDSELLNFQISNASVTAISLFTGHILVENLDLSGEGEGIWMYGSDANEIRGLTATNMGCAVRMLDSNANVVGNEVKRNDLSNCDRGVLIQGNSSDM